jgi:hypothetical protein
MPHLSTAGCNADRIFPQQAPKDLRLDVLIMREPIGDRQMWIAQCLQYDIVAQSEMLEDLRNGLSGPLSENIILALENNEEPLAMFKPAPERYWEAYKKTDLALPAFPVSIPQQ